MKIDSIQLKHALHFADLKLKFSDKPITLILGDQSSGKTGILKFTYQALTWFAAGMFSMSRYFQGKWKKAIIK